MRNELVFEPPHRYVFITQPEWCKAAAKAENHGSIRTEPLTLPGLQLVGDWSHCPEGFGIRFLINEAHNK
jgi:hypothetical protein